MLLPPPPPAATTTTLLLLQLLPPLSLRFLLLQLLDDYHRLTNTASDTKTTATPLLLLYRAITRMACMMIGFSFKTSNRKLQALCTAALTK